VPASAGAVQSTNAGNIFPNDEWEGLGELFSAVPDPLLWEHRLCAEKIWVSSYARMYL